MLRALRSPKTGKPLLTYQAIADVFGYEDRRNINNVVREYTKCNENFFDDLRRKRNVDARVVEAVKEELRDNVLVKSDVLRDRVNQRLRRRDLTSDNITAALEQIPCTAIRSIVLREIEKGAFHPKEELVLEELFAMFEQSNTVKKGAHVLPSSSPIALSPKPEENDTPPMRALND